MKPLVESRETERAYYAKRKAADPTYKTGRTRPRSEAQWSWHLTNKYGIDSDQFVVMFEAQGGHCAICDNSLFDVCHIDHCHITGKVRGLLCRGCNQGLGSFNDSPAKLRQAVEYLSC